MLTITIITYIHHHSSTHVHSLTHSLIHSLSPRQNNITPSFWPCMCPFLSTERSRRSRCSWHIRHRPCPWWVRHHRHVPHTPWIGKYEYSEYTSDLQPNIQASVHEKIAVWRRKCGRPSNNSTNHYNKHAHSRAEYAFGHACHLFATTYIVCREDHVWISQFVQFF